MLWYTILCYVVLCSVLRRVGQSVRFIWDFVTMLVTAVGPPVASWGLLKPPWTSSLPGASRGFLELPGTWPLGRPAAPCGLLGVPVAAFGFR